MIFSLLAATLCSGEAIRLKNRGDAGMFSMFSDVLGALHLYETGKLSGLAIDFGCDGHYYDPIAGPNWWSYYFEPMSLGDSSNSHAGVFEEIQCRCDRFFYSTREEAAELISKHIHIRPELSQRIDAFYESRFEDAFAIGVHYRGTDAPDRASYELYFDTLQRAIDALAPSLAWKIYIASDEEPFIQAAAARFPGKAVYQEGALRSGAGGEPLHKNASLDRRRQGEEAVIDWAMLSRCSIFLASFSNLSLYVALKSPKMPVIDVTGKLRPYLKNG